VPSTQWYPPHCFTQYHLEAIDSVGGLGATSEYQYYAADVARYIALRPSTLVLHAAVVRTGGVLPDSALACAGVRAYPRPFCGTDAQSLQAEYRLDDALARRVHFILFTETAAGRVRGGTQAFSQPAFQWHADTGVAITYRGFRLDVARGTLGNRITLELGQSY
jgi:hypothetical protein